MSAPISGGVKILFSEKIRWSIGLWFFMVFIIGSINIAIWAAFGNNPTQLSLSITSLILILAWIMSTLENKVTPDQLTSGNFKISREHIIKVTPLGKAEMRLISGVNCDPAAHLELRFWVHTGVKIEIADPKDPTPYILISTKKYNELSAILTD